MKRTGLSTALKLYQLSRVHPAAAAFPMLPDDEYWALVADIKAHGFATHGKADEKGRLIDGRNRICASVDADVDFVIDVEVFGSETDILDWIVSNNVKRRQLTASQRAAVGADLLPIYEQAAKERQREHGGTAPGRKTLLADLREVKGNGRLATDDAAQAVGASARGVQQAKRVKQADKALFAEVKNGTLALDAAEREVKRREAKVKQLDPQQNVTPANQVTVITPAGKETMIASPKSVRFNRTNDNVDWAAWTWNPVTGCEHGCTFCYAREIAYSDRMAEYYPNKFAPTYHEYRLTAPANTPLPSGDDPREQRVFVCSMADLFGKWVPDAWIEAVFAACLESPEWRYLFLTKWPARYAKMPLISGAWYGASVVQQADVKRVTKAMQTFQSSDAIKWLSVEPLLEAIRFDDLSWCDLLVVGSQTSTNQPSGFVEAVAPEYDWVHDLVQQCREFGVPYYLKANLCEITPGMKLPKNSPRALGMR